MIADLVFSDVRVSLCLTRRLPEPAGGLPCISGYQW